MRENLVVTTFRDLVDVLGGTLWPVAMALCVLSIRAGRDWPEPRGRIERYVAAGLFLVIGAPSAWTLARYWLRIVPGLGFL